MSIVDKAEITMNDNLDSFIKGTVRVVIQRDKTEEVMFDSGVVENAFLGSQLIEICNKVAFSNNQLFSGLFLDGKRNGVDSVYNNLKAFSYGLLQQYGIVLLSNDDAELQTGQISSGGEALGYAELSNLGKSYSGMSTVKGSVNLVESHFDNEENAFTIVVDWPTHAANGQFNSVSLLPFITSTFNETTPTFANPDLIPYPMQSLNQCIGSISLSELTKVGITFNSASRPDYRVDYPMRIPSCFAGMLTPHHALIVQGLLVYTLDINNGIMTASSSLKNTSGNTVDIRKARIIGEKLYGCVGLISNMWLVWDLNNLTGNAIQSLDFSFIGATRIDAIGTTNIPGNFYCYTSDSVNDPSVGKPKRELIYEVKYSDQTILNKWQGLSGGDFPGSDSGSCQIIQDEDHPQKFHVVYGMCFSWFDNSNTFNRVDRFSNGKRAISYSLGGRIACQLMPLVSFNRAMSERYVDITTYIIGGDSQGTNNERSQTVTYDAYTYLRFFWGWYDRTSKSIVHMSAWNHYGEATSLNNPKGFIGVYTIPLCTGITNKVTLPAPATKTNLDTLKVTYKLQLNGRGSIFRDYR